MFVAYTGYGRIATLGEEVLEPRRNIPRAMVAALGCTALLYTAVAFAVADAGGGSVVEIARRQLSAPSAAMIGVCAVVAMVGVLLNLVLGLSRVWLAMGRGGDAPTFLARINAAGDTPVPAVLLTGGLIAGLCLVGNLQTTWSFSAVTVLLYYGLTNLAALRLPPADRFCPRWVSVVGLVGCLSLAGWVEPRVWWAALAALVAGLIWRGLYRMQRAGSGA